MFENTVSIYYSLSTFFRYPKLLEKMVITYFNTYMKYYYSILF